MRYDDGNRRRELLELLAEECAESIQVAMKALRHGLASSHRDYGNRTNQELLETELGHVLAAIRLLVNAGAIDEHTLQGHINRKLKKVVRYLHFQPRPR